MNVTSITNIGDPQILLYEGKYYCYATYDDGKSGFYVWESEDMVNWSDKILCFDAIKEWGYRSFWAPEVVYHNGKFVMHYTARHREKNSLRIGVAVSENPLGPFRDVHGAPMFDLGYATIDGSVLRCGENIIDGVMTSQVYCVRLNDDLTEAVGEHVLMTTPTEPFELKSLTENDPHIWNEGPCVIRVGNKYVMNYSANHYASNDYAICVATADTPFGPWKKSINNPVLSCRAELFGAGHNTFFESKDGKLLTSFHIQTDPSHPCGDRTTVIGEVAFSEKNGDIFETIE